VKSYSRPGIQYLNPARIELELPDADTDDGQGDVGAGLPVDDGLQHLP
jgi:hypothetical protein